VRFHNAHPSGSSNPSQSAQVVTAAVSGQGPQNDSRSEASNEQAPPMISKRQDTDNWEHFFHHDEWNDDSHD